MTDTMIFGGLAVAHVWQSVAVAAVLAGVLIFGRKLTGATRYLLAGLAFLACLALPLASFIPGESLVRTALNTLDAPITLKTEEQLAEERAAAAAAAVKPEKPMWRKAAEAGGAPTWALDLGTRIVQAEARAKADAEAAGLAARPGSVETARKGEQGGMTLAKLAELVGPALPAAIEEKPAAKPAFRLPEFRMPAIDVPDLTLPLLLVWIAGSLLMLVRTGRDLIAVERLVARARAVELPAELRRRFGDVRVAVSSDAPGPMAAGLLHPTIVLPESAASNINIGMTALLEHERAHIVRRDMAAALVQRVILALLWWSPALHWISRRIDEERELACDEAAVECTGDARAFARSLTAQAENQLWARAPRLAVGAIGPRSQFGRRIKRLIDIAKNGAGRSKYSGRVAFSGLVIAVTIAALATPRILAEPKAPPADNGLAGAPQRSVFDIAKSGDGRLNRVRYDGQELDGANDDDLPQDIERDLDELGESLEELMDGLSEEIELSLSDISPELDIEMQGLVNELSALGGAIAIAINAELAQELPGLIEEIQQSVQESRNSGWTEEDRARLRAEMDQLRVEMRQKFGPEFREDVRREVERARAEVDSHRDEWRRAAEESRRGMEIAREAMAKAREEIAAARARGDFDVDRDFDFDFDFDFDSLKDLEKLKELEKLKDQDWGRYRDKRGVRVRINGDDNSPESRLYNAARRGNEDQVRQLIKSGANVNTAIPGDGTALIAAARYGREDIVRILLDAGADPNKASPGDGSPLIMAAEHGHKDIVELLLARGAKINAGVPGDGNALIKAAHRGETDIVDLLLKRGADVNAYVPGDETPLMAAAEAGELDIVKQLVSRGAKVNAAYTVESYRGGEELRSALSQAQKYGHDDVVDYLKSKGAVAAPKPLN